MKRKRWAGEIPKAVLTKLAGMNLPADPAAYTAALEQLMKENRDD